MSRLKKTFQRTLHEIENMPRILQIVFAILLAIFIYQMVSLYYIQIEINKIQHEIEVLKRWPF